MKQAHSFDLDLDLYLPQNSMKSYTAYTTGYTTLILNTTACRINRRDTELYNQRSIDV